MPWPLAPGLFPCIAARRLNPALGAWPWIIQCLSWIMFQGIAAIPHWLSSWQMESLRWQRGQGGGFLSCPKFLVCLLPLSEKCLSFIKWNSPCLGTLALGHVILNIQEYLIFKMLHYSSTSAVNISINLLSFHFWRVSPLPLYWYSLTGTSSWKQTVLIPFFLCDPKPLFLVLHSYHTSNDTQDREVRDGT